MYLKTLLILSALLLLVDAEVAMRFVAPDATYMLNAHSCAPGRGQEQKVKARRASALVARARANAVSPGLERGHAELSEEYGLAAEVEKAPAATAVDQRAARIERLRGIIALESDAFRKVLDGLGEGRNGRIPEKERKALRELILASKSGGSRSSEARLKSGVGGFQPGELDSAIRMWQSALVLDPENGTADGYKKRAEAVKGPRKQRPGGEGG